MKIIQLCSYKNFNSLFNKINQPFHNINNPFIQQKFIKLKCIDSMFSYIRQHHQPFILVYDINIISKYLNNIRITHDHKFKDIYKNNIELIVLIRKLLKLKSRLINEDTIHCELINKQLYGNTGKVLKIDMNHIHTLLHLNYIPIFSPMGVLHNKCYSDVYVHPEEITFYLFNHFDDISVDYLYCNDLNYLNLKI